jgi:O-antigen ligase
MIYLLGGYMWLYVHRPFEVWPALGTLQIERIYMCFMLLAWLFSPDKGWTPNRIHFALAFFAATATLSWICSPFMGETICMETIENYYKVTVFYVMVVTTIRDESQLRLLLKMYLFSVGLYMTHSIVELINGRYQWRMGICRMIGVDTSFGDPNTFASSLLYTLPLMLAFWSRRLSSSQKFGLVVYALAVCFCIVKTGSRAAFLGLCLFVLLALMARTKRKAMVLVFGSIACVCGGGLALLVMPAELQNRYLTIVDSSYGPKNAAASAHGRMEGLRLGFAAWQRSPLLGHGPRAFELATGSEIGAHSIYGQVISELGTMGVVALIVMVICFVRNWMEVRRIYRAHPEQPRDFLFEMSQGLGIITLLLLVMGGAGHSLFRYNWQWFAAFQALTVHCVQRKFADAAQQAVYIRRRPTANCAVG